MKKSIFFILFIHISILSFSQVANKNFTLSIGYGYFNQFKNSDAGGNIWIQTDYKFSKSFSFATEFENARFAIPILYGVSGLPNRQFIYDNSFAFLPKYHFNLKTKLQVSAGAGFVYRLRARDHFDSTISNLGDRNYTRQVEATDNLGMPVILEIHYPLNQFLFIGARIRTNFWLSNLNTNPDWHRRATYAGGLLLAIKL
ncbi:MAG: hypothetical protein K2X48_20265 [Chitinophagaceae bacterium]|nr:hypothetical protein [Chitinophagaceae bacterium]